MHQVFITNTRTKTQEVYNVTGIIQTMRLRLRMLSASRCGESVRVWNIKGKHFGLI